MKLKIPRPSIVAELAPQTANPQDRTVDVTFYTGAVIPRYSWLRGEYTLTFSTDKAAVRLGALKSGRAPVLETHSDFTTRDVLGVVEKAWLEDGQAKATMRFLQGDEDADRVWNKIEQKVLRNVSMGVRIHTMKETSGAEDKIKAFQVTDWEPFEISVVPMGADPGAQIQLAFENGEQEIEVEELAARATRPQEQTMEQPTDAGTEARTQELNAATLAAQTLERDRVTFIHRMQQKHSLDETFTATHLESGTSKEQFGILALEALAARSAASHQTQGHHAEILRDERVTLRQNADAVIMHLFDRKNVVDGANDFRGMSVLRLAEEVLNRTGRSTRGMGRAQIAELSMHATADFPLILADSARKQMLAAYALANPTYKIWAKSSTTPDFKTMSRLRLSETPSFLKVPEGAQITLGTMTESREQYAIATYGRGVSFTRQMLINDDLGAFNDLLSAFGAQAARLENKTVYAILTANAVMADSIALFYATHSNLGTGVIGNTALDAMFTAMATQKGLDGVSVLNLTPKYLITPVAKASTAQNALTATGNNLAPSSQNWFAGRLTPVADAELDSSSTVVWYAAADPSIAPGVEYAHLEGAEGPQSIRKENEEAILGVQIYMFLDFGAKAVDWRPLYKSSGA